MNELLYFGLFLLQQGHSSTLSFAGQVAHLLRHFRYGDFDLPLLLLLRRRLADEVRQLEQVDDVVVDAEPGVLEDRVDGPAGGERGRGGQLAHARAGQGQEAGGGGPARGRGHGGMENKV